jgi:hypothetical protein
MKVMMKKTVLMVISLVLLMSCAQQKVIYSASTVQDISTNQIKITFAVTDDKSNVMNYTLFLNGVSVANGSMLNNTEKYVDLDLDLSLVDNNITLMVSDKQGNTAVNSTIIRILDNMPPTIIRVVITERI